MKVLDSTGLTALKNWIESRFFPKQGGGQLSLIKDGEDQYLTINTVHGSPIYICSATIAEAKFPFPITVQNNGPAISEGGISLVFPRGTGGLIIQAEGVYHIYQTGATEVKANYKSWSDIVG